jgi:hypothetical protein
MRKPTENPSARCRTFRSTHRWRLLSATCGGTLLALAVASTGRADTVTLRTGAMVRGRVLDSTAALGHRPTSKAERERAAKLVAVSTLTGAKLVFEAPDVATVTKRSFVLEEFEMRKRHTPNDVDSQWRLAEWCKSRSLRAQREETLRAILVLDPDNIPAHQGLGQTKRDGEWRSYDEEMRARGFVKFEGKYVAQQEVDILKRLHQRKRQDQDWVEKVRTAARSLSSTDPERRRRASDTLMKITDTEAIPALNRVLLSSHDDGMRDLYVQILSKIPDTTATTPHLVDVALFDGSKQVRISAQQAILEHPRNTTAAGLFARQLRNTDNEIVRRAGLMLEKIGDPSVIPQLIDAIITTHGVPQRVIDNSNSYGMSHGGGVTGGLSPDLYTKLQTGAYPGATVQNQDGSSPVNVKTVMVDREFRNAEVLSALQSITKQSYGFDKDAWRHWWGERQTAGPLKTSSTQ